MEGDNKNFFKKDVEKSEIYRKIENGEVKKKDHTTTSHFNFRRTDGFKEFLEVNNLVEEDEELQEKIYNFGDNYRNNKYKILNKDFKFVLSDSVLWIIGDVFNDYDNKFILSFNNSNRKILLNRNVYNKLYEQHIYDKTINKEDCLKYKWFIELYDRNMYYDRIYLKVEKNEQEKKLIFDVRLNSINQNLPSKECGFPHNRIIFGAPGTGKSFELNNDKSIFDDRFERVTFHPDYSYAHFVGTYKPVSKKDKLGNEIIQYKYVPGPFLRILIKALNNPNKDYLLLIEEINRANVAAVFGEVFQLLDRDEKGISEYSINTSYDMRKFLKSNLNEGVNFKELKIPNNMYIWATMNSADQGVYMMDTAFKRRWDFDYLGIDEGENKIKNKFINISGEIIEWNSLRKAINWYLSKKINEDKLLGPFFISPKYLPDGCDDERFDYNYFLEDSDGSKQFINIFKNKVLMYLFEDAAKGFRNKIFCEDLIKNEKILLSEIFSNFNKEGRKIFKKEINEKYKEFRKCSEYQNLLNEVNKYKDDES